MLPKQPGAILHGKYTEGESLTKRNIILSVENTRRHGQFFAFLSAEHSYLVRPLRQGDSYFTQVLITAPGSLHLLYTQFLGYVVGRLSLTRV
jgi:hypothetical protein